MIRRNRSNRVRPMFGLAALLAFTPGCVTVAEFRKLEDQVARMKKGDGAVGQQSRVADLSAELSDLRAEVEDLRGRLEVGEHNTTQALEEARSARREAAGGMGGPPGPGPGPGPSGPPSDPGAPPGARGPGSPPRAAGQAAREELDAYRTAYDAWRRDEGALCVDRFRDFLQTYPSSSYADAAAYWMADCYYKQGDYQTAILRFDDVASRYPDSDKASEALYRQGEALLRLGPSYGGAARKAFERVIQEYPKSKRAEEAERQLQELRGR